MKITEYSPLHYLWQQPKVIRDKEFKKYNFISENYFSFTPVLPPLMEKELVKNIENFYTNYWLRSKYVKNYNWYYITREVFDILTAYLNDLGPVKILEIAGGTGWLTHILRKKGLNVTLNELVVPSKDYYQRKQQYVPIDVKGNILHRDISGFNVFILTWPNYEEPWSLELLKKLPKSSILIYQGETKGGCCATPEFFEHLDENFSEISEITSSLNEHHVRFMGMHDWWSVYIKN